MWKNKWMLENEAGGDGEPTGGNSSSVSEVDWAGMHEEMDADPGVDGEGLESLDPSPAPAAPRQEGVSPPTPPTPASPAPAPTAPAQSPNAGTPPVPAPAPATPPGPPAAPTPAPVAENQPAPAPAPDLAAQRSQYVSSLATQYQLTPEQEELALTNPGEFLPAFAAEIHTRAIETATRGIMEALPQLIPQLVARAHSEREAEGAFFSAHPELNDELGRRAVMQYGQAFRAVSPNATRDEFIQKVGLAARVALGRLPAEGGNNAPSAPVPANAPPPAPAAPGGAAPMPLGRQSTNPFEILFEQLLEED